MANELIKSAIQTNSTIQLGANINTSNASKRYFAYTYGWNTNRTLYYTQTSNIFLKKSNYPITLQEGDYIVIRSDSTYGSNGQWHLLAVLNTTSSWGGDPAYELEDVDVSANDNPIYVFKRNGSIVGPTDWQYLILYNLPTNRYYEGSVVQDYGECVAINLSVNYNATQLGKNYGFYIIANFINEEDQIDMLLLEDDSVFEGDTPIYFYDTWQRDDYLYVYKNGESRGNLNTSYIYGFQRCFDYEEYSGYSLYNYGYVYATYNAQYDEYYWNLGLAHINNGYIVNNILQYQVSSSNKRILKTGNLMGLYNPAGAAISAGSYLGTESYFSSFSYDIGTAVAPSTPILAVGLNKGYIYIQKATRAPYTNYIATFYKCSSTAWSQIGSVNLRYGSTTQNAVAFLSYSKVWKKYRDIDRLIYMGSDGRVWLTSGTQSSSSSAPTRKLQSVPIPYKMA